MDEKINRQMFNTTVDKKTQDDFKAMCKEMGMPMNVVLEAFMRQFCKKEFVLGFSKNENLVTVDITDEENSVVNSDNDSDEN